MPTSSTTAPAALLIPDRRFQDLLPAYLAPYLIFVVMASLPETLLPVEMGQALKLLATGAVLLAFRRVYRFGPLKAMHGLIAVLGLPVVLLCWIGPFYLLGALGVSDIVNGGGDRSFSFLYVGLRLINSVILVAVFEELLLRVFVMGWLHQAGKQRRAKGLIGAVLDTLAEQPSLATGLPLGTFAVVGTTIIFAAGHQVYEYPSCVLYFLATTWLYYKSGSLWVCMIVHGLTNLVVGLLATFGGLGWLW